MKLPKVPGAYVFGVFGGFGSGKSLYLVEKGIEFACYHRKQIAANFYLNDRVIREYGKKYNLDWLKICRVKHSLSFEELLSQEKSILLLDEAGIEIFSRNWSQRKNVELDALFRIRHYKNKLIYAAQEWNQVDIQFRRMTHLCMWVRGFQMFPPHGDPVLVSRLILFFNPYKFEDFIKDPINKIKIVYPIVSTGFRFEFDVIKLNPKFKYLFAIYNSFDSHRSRKREGHRHRYIEYVADGSNGDNNDNNNNDSNNNDNGNCKGKGKVVDIEDLLL